MKKIFNLLLFISIFTFSTQLLAQTANDDSQRSTTTEEEKKEPSRPLPEESKRPKKETPKINTNVLKLLSEAKKKEEEKRKAEAAKTRKNNSTPVLSTSAASQSNVLKLLSDDSNKKNEDPSRDKKENTSDSGKAKINTNVLKLLSDDKKKEEEKKNLTRPSTNSNQVTGNPNDLLNNVKINAKLPQENYYIANPPVMTTTPKTDGTYYTPNPPPSTARIRNNSDLPPAQPANTPPTHTEENNPKGQINKTWIDNTIVKTLRPKQGDKGGDSDTPPGKDNPTDGVPISDSPVQTLGKTVPPIDTGTPGTPPLSTPSPPAPAVPVTPPGSSGIRSETPGDTSKTNPGDNPRDGVQKRKVPCDEVTKVVTEYNQSCLSKSENKQCTTELREYYARICGSESVDPKVCISQACGEEKPEDNNCKLTEADYEVLKQVMFMEFCVRGDCDPELAKKTEAIFGMSTEELQAVYAQQGEAALMQSNIPLGLSYCKFIYKKTHCLPSFCQSCDMPESVYEGLKYYSRNCEGKDLKNCPAKIQAMKQKYCDFAGRDEKTGEAVFKERTVAACMKDHGCFMLPPTEACVEKLKPKAFTSDMNGGNSNISGQGPVPPPDGNGSGAASGGGDGRRTSCSLVKDPASNTSHGFAYLMMGALFILLLSRFSRRKEKMMWGLLLLLSFLPAFAFAQATEEAKEEEKKVEDRMIIRGLEKAPQQSLRSMGVKVDSSQIFDGNNVFITSDTLRAKGFIPRVVSPSDQKCSLDAEQLGFLNSFYQNHYSNVAKGDEAAVEKMREQYEAICTEKKPEPEASTSEAPAVSEEYKVASEARQEESVRKQLRAMGKSDEEIKEEMAKLEESSKAQVMSSQKKLGADICGCLIAKSCDVPDFCQSYCELKDPFARTVIEEVQKKCATDRNKCSPSVQEAYGKVCKDLDPATCLKAYHCPSNVPAGPQECPGTQEIPPKKLEDGRISAEKAPEEAGIVKPTLGDAPEEGGLSGNKPCSLYKGSVQWEMAIWMALLLEMIPLMGLGVLRYRKR